MMNLMKVFQIPNKKEGLQEVNLEKYSEDLMIIIKKLAKKVMKTNHSSSSLEKKSRTKTIPTTVISDEIIRQNVYKYKFINDLIL